MFLSILCSSFLIFGCGGNGSNDNGGAEANVINVSQEKITLKGEGESSNVSVKTDHEWGTYTSDSWLTASPSSSVQHEGTLTITASRNPLPSPREGTVTVMSGSARKTITITQEAGPTDPNSTVPDGYQLVWNDEFDQGSVLDGTKWTHEVQPAGWVNNELQEYVNGEYNGHRVTELKDGKLLITAFKDGGKVFSGRVYANVNVGWKYGIFEAKIKLPKGRGTWPAYWMMPANNDFSINPWPRCGEIDIMEEVGFNPNYTSSSIHTQSYNHTIGTQKTAERFTSGAEDDFHVYRLEWTQDYIQTYVDGVKLLHFDNDGQNKVETWPFNKNFYVILNLAWGGMWGGQRGVDETALPCTMEVDYVRVFQKK